MLYHTIFSVICFIASLHLKISNGQGTFSNPILETKSADPAVLLHNGYYYMSLSTNNDTEITILKSQTLSNFRDSESKIVYTVEEGYYGLWAPEIQLVDGNIYVYFCMDSGSEELKRSYVIRADDSAYPMGSWTPEAKRLMPDLDDFAIDGTIMKHGNGKQYYVWAGIKNGTSLFVAPLIDPVTVGASKLLLRRPTLPWEGVTVEGAYFFYNNSHSFMGFSGGSTWGPDYAMGYMSIPSDKDPMNINNWWFGPDEPILSRNDEEGVYTTGHASFTLSPDRTETWMVYHGTDVTEDVLEHRIARIERIDWDENGMPVFPRPHGRNSTLPVPSGEDA